MKRRIIEMVLSVLIIFVGSIAISTTNFSEANAKLTDRVVIGSCIISTGESTKPEEELEEYVDDNYLMEDYVIDSSDNISTDSTPSIVEEDTGFVSEDNGNDSDFSDESYSPEEKIITDNEKNEGNKGEDTSESVVSDEPIESLSYVLQSNDSEEIIISEGDLLATISSTDMEDISGYTDQISFTNAIESDNIEDSTTALYITTTQEGADTQVFVETENDCYI